MSEQPSFFDFLAPEGPAHMDPRFPPFHPGWRRAAHERGVAFFGPWEEVYAGFPEHVRRAAVALSQAGLPVHLRSSRGGLQFQTTKDEALALAFEALKDELSPLLNAEIKTYAADIWQMIADDTGFHRIAGPSHHYLSDKELAHIYARRIISTVFERDTVSKAAIACLAAIAEVWVANHKDRTMLIEHGISPDRVAVIPIPFFPTDPLLSLRDKPRFPGPVRYYHIGKWEPRKAQHEMLGAFLYAFSPGDDVQLFIKTSMGSPVLSDDYPRGVEASIARHLADPEIAKRGWTTESLSRQVFVIQQRLSPARMVQLHRSGDVYLSLARGEGFDMPAFDAKLGGRLMVYTPSGGPQDYAEASDCLVPRVGSVPTHPLYGWGSRYLDYDREDAVAALRCAYRLVQSGSLKSVTQHFERFSAVVVGAAMRARIEPLML